MEFVGYTVGELVGVANIIHPYDGNYVIDDGGRTKLAIRLPSNNNTLFALFLWDEYESENVEAMRIVVQTKAEETIRFFQETTAVINDYLPRPIYNDVQTILRQNNGTIGRYVENNNTDILIDEGIITIERDIRTNVYYVRIRGIVTISLPNENSATSVYRLIKKDLSNYAFFRWGRPQR